MAPSRVNGGLTQSSTSSGIFSQGDGQPQNVINTHLSSSFGNSTNSIPGIGRYNFSPVSGEINQTVLNNVANSANSLGASSLVTDANSAFSGGPQLQRNASFNTDSYMRLPTSPMSFTSNNISVSGSSIVDGSSTLHHDPNSQHHHFQQGGSRETSLPVSQTGQVQMPMGARILNTVSQDPSSLSQVQKKPRLDTKQDDIAQQQVMQHLFQGDQMQLQSHNPQFQALMQQQRLRQHQQNLQAMQRAQLQQQQQQQAQLRQQIQQQNMQHMALMKNPHDTGGICARRLMQYLFHRRKPAENTISYWRSFVKQYYAPCAKKRWCLSQYENVVHHAFGVFPQATADAWHCDICGSKSGRGFEATYEVLPRLNEIKFSSGMIDELLYLDMPLERRISGIMVLQYEKAIQESVYDQVRIVREGHLRIIFAQDLKILSWEFCARRHEELLPRRIVASQVNQFLQVAQKCQSTIDESGSEGLSNQDLQSNSNMVVTAGRQLAKSLELQSLNDLGFSKRYMRSMQISEVVNSMKDLMDFCDNSKAGPIEALKNYPRHTLQLQKMQGMEQRANMQQGLPTNRNNNMMPMQPGVNNNVGNNNNPPGIAGRTGLNGPAAAALALTNYQNMLRQNSVNHQEASYLQGGPVGGFSSPMGHQQQQSSMSNQPNQQQMIQHILDNMSNNKTQNLGCFRNNTMGFPVPSPTSNVSGDNMVDGGRPILNECGIFQTNSNNDSSVAVGTAIGFSPNMSGAADVAVADVAAAQNNMHLPDEMVQELTNNFTDNDYFSNNLDDTLAGYDWKA